MPSSHETHHSNPHELDFMQLFDGTQPEVLVAEQLDAKHVFSQFADDAITANAEAWKIVPLNPEQNALTITKAIPVEGGAWRVNILAHSPRAGATPVLPGNSLFKISLEFIDHNNIAHEMHQYGCDEAGVLIREDFESASTLEADMSEDDALNDDFLGLILANEDPFTFASDDMTAKAVEEQASGRNAQPVGVQEIKGLMTFMEPVFLPSTPV